MKPDPKLIDSMALRYRHDFGLLDQAQKDSIRTTMKQLWEEVVGLGFYKAKKTNRSIPHDETIPNIPTWDKSHPGGFSLSSEPDEVPYGSICSCNPTNGGSGICGCTIGNTMVSNPKKYGNGLISNITTDTVIGMPNGNISFTDS